MLAAPLATFGPLATPVRHLTLLATALLASACAADGLSGVTSGADATARKSGETPPVPSPATASASNALAGASFWVDPASNARRTADAWRSSRPADAAQLDKIAGQPQVRWFGEWNTAVARDADAAMTAMSAGGALPVLVAYNLPQRDCGGMSGNNTTSATAYRSWIAALADGIGARRAVVILEPDALAGIDCLSDSDRQSRLDLMRYAVQVLRARGTVLVYIDAGNPGWQPPATMADRLTHAGIDGAQGFALNVSNFVPTAANVAYGRQLSSRLGGRHFVVDTGRNGLGSNGEICNPAGRALGERPTADTGDPLVDAFLWVKAPGESDGVCGGAPASGQWMPEYALGLASRALW